MAIINRFLILTSACLICINCEKDNLKDPLVQYLEFTLNNKVIKLVECDTIKFSPIKFFENDYNNARFVYRTLSEIDILNTGKDRVASTYQINFFKEFLKDQMYSTQNGNFDKEYLKQTAFDSLFNKGKVDFADQDCIDSINNNLLVGFSFFNIYSEYITYQKFCLDYDVSKYYNHDNSYFRIDSVLKYKHILFGDCVLLIGEFSAKLYIPLDAYHWKDSLILNNGKFKILLTDNYWH